MNTPKPLDVWENLLIRACKNNTTSEYRLKRIFGKRCALPTDYVQIAYIIDMLLEIIERYNLCSLPEFVQKMRNCKYWGELYPKTKKYDDPVLEAAISIICGAAVKRFPNYRSPLYWRLPKNQG